VHTLVVLDGSSGLRIDSLTDAAGSTDRPKGGAATGFGGTAPKAGPGLVPGGSACGGRVVARRRSRLRRPMRLRPRRVMLSRLARARRPRLRQCASRVTGPREGHNPCELGAPEMKVTSGVTAVRQDSMVGPLYRCCAPGRWRSRHG
jgi:hypothetical protein